MTFVAASSSLGTLIHPIMLNDLFSRVGYSKTTIFSTSSVTFMLLRACILIRPPLPASMSRPPILKMICRFYMEWSFIMLSAGWIPSEALSNDIYYRPFFFMIGFYYPFLFLQAWDSGILLGMFGFYHSSLALLIFLGLARHNECIEILYGYAAGLCK